MLVCRVWRITVVIICSPEGYSPSDSSDQSLQVKSPYPTLPCLMTVPDSPVGMLSTMYIHVLWELLATTLITACPLIKGKLPSEPKSRPSLCNHVFSVIKTEVI